MRPGITLAMIVRDDSTRLRRCLKSVQGAVDAIAVVDTGSRDDSVKAARHFGASVREMEWPGAFDAARNASLEMVETEWVLWLDSDEWLLEGTAAAVRGLISKEDAWGFLLVRRDLLADGSFAEQHLLRLWRHAPEVRFEGSIHEHLDLELLERLNAGRSLMSTSVPFLHDGYSSGSPISKAERNLPLLRKEVERGPKTLYYEIELAQTLKVLGRPEAQEVEKELARKVLAMRDLDAPPDNTTALFFVRWLADLPDSELRSSETELLLRLARGWHGDHPGARFMAAQTEIRRGNLRQALEDLLAIDAMVQSGSYDRYTSTNPVVLKQGYSLNLALVAHQLGRLDLARRHYERVLQFEPDHEAAQANLRRL